MDVVEICKAIRSFSSSSLYRNFDIKQITCTETMDGRSECICIATAVF
jgi:hypothetical protein